MAAPIPNSGYANDELSNIAFDLDRGAQELDSLTKSAKDKAVAFTTENICDEEAYIEARISLNLNELIDCVPVQNSSASIKVRLASGGATGASTASDIDAIMAELIPDLKAAVAAQV